MVVDAVDGLGWMGCRAVGWFLECVAEAAGVALRTGGAPGDWVDGGGDFRCERGALLRHRYLGAVAGYVGLAFKSGGRDGECAGELGGVVGLSFS